MPNKKQPQYNSVGEAHEKRIARRRARKQGDDKIPSTDKRTITRKGKRSIVHRAR